MIAVDRPGAVELLQQQHTGQGVRQRQIGKPNALMGGITKGGFQPVGASNDQRHIVPTLLPALQLRGEIAGGECGSTLVQDHEATGLRQRRLNALPLGSLQQLARFSRPCFGLDGPHLQPQVGRKSSGVVVAGGLCPVRHPLPDGHHDQLHEDGFLVVGLRAAGRLAVDLAVVLGLLTTSLAMGALLWVFVGGVAALATGTDLALDLAGAGFFLAAAAEDDAAAPLPRVGFWAGFAPLDGVDLTLPGAAGLAEPWRAETSGEGLAGLSLAAP